MDNLLGYISIMFGFCGTLLLALDVVLPKYLEAIRNFLLGFSESIREASIVPSDKRVSAYRKTKFEAFFNKIPPEQSFKDAYFQNLTELNYNPDLNLDVKYRSFIYILSTVLVLGVGIYVWYLNGISSILTSSGLKFSVFFLFIIIGILGAWMFDALPLLLPDDKEIPMMPPFYKMSRRHPNIPVIIFNLVQICVNLIAKIVGRLIYIAFVLEKFTIPNQSPRIFGIILISLAFLFQFIVMVISR